MMNKIKVIVIALILTACSNQNISFDASGSFEAVETIISAESSGIIKRFDIEEGQNLVAGQKIGTIDSLQLYLKKKQLEAQIDAILSRKPNVNIQLSALQQQLKTAKKEKLRIENLLKGNATTTKHLDDINAQIKTIKKQLDAKKSTLIISNKSLSKEVVPLQIQIEQLDDLLAKCKIMNPIKGTVLVKYAEANEMTTAGKPLYSIADLSNIILRVYISNNQLSQVTLNQNVKVLTDSGSDGYKETNGTIIWISDKAEFTPKTIQTKDERANLVYAVKIKVQNDGFYKIGMYGEIKL